MKLIGKQIVVELPENRACICIKNSASETIWGCECGAIARHEALTEVAKMNPAWEVDKNALKRVILRVKINRTLVPFLVTKEGSEYLEEIADTLISNPSAWMKRKDSDDKEKS